jgi:hypothetical protein
VGEQGSAVGTFAVSWVADAAVTTARTLSMVSVSAAAVALNPVPVIVTVAPGVSVAGEIERMVGAPPGGGGAITEIAELSDCVSLVAVIMAFPIETPVTSPVLSTFAFAVSDDVQTTARPVSTLPLGSSVAAVNCCVAPGTMDADAGSTFTRTTGRRFTVSVACACLVPATAFTVVVPGATAVTRPSLDTVATLGEPVDQVTVPVAIDVPCWSAPDAEAVTLDPTYTVGAESATDSVVSTGGSGATR